MTEEVVIESKEKETNFRKGANEASNENFRFTRDFQELIALNNTGHPHLKQRIQVKI